MWLWELEREYMLHGAWARLIAQGMGSVLIIIGLK